MRRNSVIALLIFFASMFLHAQELGINNQTGVGILINQYSDHSNPEAQKLINVSVQKFWETVGIREISKLSENILYSDHAELDLLCAKSIIQELVVLDIFYRSNGIFEINSFTYTINSNNTVLKGQSSGVKDGSGLSGQLSKAYTRVLKAGNTDSPQDNLLTQMEEDLGYFMKSSIGVSQFIHSEGNSLSFSYRKPKGVVAVEYKLVYELNNIHIGSDAIISGKLFSKNISKWVDVFGFGFMMSLFTGLDLGERSFLVNGHTAYQESSSIYTVSMPIYGSKSILTMAKIQLSVMAGYRFPIYSLYDAGRQIERTTWFDANKFNTNSPFLGFEFRL
jgi:hypothetical protein